MMKQLLCLLLVPVMLAVFSCAESCQKGNKDRSLFDTVCGADDGLEAARSGGAVVFEGMRCTSGNDVWQEFEEKIDRGEAASVLCANYYVIDREHVSEELYRQEKDKYPMLFFSLVEYDGNKFTVTSRKSDEKEVETAGSFNCMIHCTGKAPEQASFSEYDYYVLTDDPDCTWEQIEAGLYSSQYRDHIRHWTVYQNIS